MAMRNLLLILTLLLSSGLFSRAENLASQPAVPTSSPNQQTSEAVVVRIPFTDSAQLARFAQSLDIWEVHHEEGYLVAMLSPMKYQALLAEGLQMSIDPDKTALLSVQNQKLPGQSGGIPAYPCYRTVEETYTDLSNLAASHPNLAKWVDTGDSWEKVNAGGTPGYDLNGLVITNFQIPGPKPVFFLMAEIHAREYTTAETAARFAEYLVNQYGIDPDITWLLDDYEVHILPMTNPDGRKLAELGQYWRKNTDNDDGCLDPYTWGTDLNRNSSFKWGGLGASTNACYETYRGPEAASEPETQAIQNYATSLFPDQRGPDDSDPAPETAQGIFITLHSYGDLVLWPWAWTTEPAPNAAQLQTLGRKLAFFNQYTPEQGVDLYPTSGSTDDWAYGELGVAAYTFEMGTTFFQDCTTFEETIYPSNLQALLYAFKAARRPYQNPSGPDSIDLSLSSKIVSAGTPVAIKVVADDTRYRAGSGEPVQSIAAVQYSLDLPSWEPGAILQPMNASDGAFDTSVETANASLDTSGLPPGRHTIFVESQDVAGNWGVPSAIFLTIIDASNAATIEGMVRSASDNLPLDATVSAGLFSTATDPANGYYHLQVLSGTYDLEAEASGYLSNTVASLQVSDRQQIQQDIYLPPYCEILSNDAESGSAGWTADPPWAISSEAAHSPSHAWSDSPAGNYDNNLDISLTSPVLDLSGFESVHLDFWHQYTLEEPPVYDFAYVETSTDGGVHWNPAASYSGNGGDWKHEEVDLPGLSHVENARLRFRLKTDEGITADGWHIDDVTISGTGATCIQPIPPTANFSSDSPVSSGLAMHFYDQTVGTPPFVYSWDFGDGIGTASSSSPEYTYPTNGTFTVTLTTTNTLGTSSTSHTVVVEPARPISITEILLHQVAPIRAYAGQTTYFSFDISPDNASKPYTYTVDYGDNTLPITSTSSYDPLPLDHVYQKSGMYSITLAAWNTFNTQPVTGTLPLRVIEPARPVPDIYLPYVGK